jgi:hypothetical protein
MSQDEGDELVNLEALSDVKRVVLVIAVLQIFGVKKLAPFKV